MQSDYLINSCESLITSYLKWLGDAESQDRDWSNLGPDLNVVDVTIENFMLDCENFMNSESFKAQSNQPCFLLLRRLYNTLASYNSDSETMLNTLSKEKLLNDPKWKEIQKLAQETQKSLVSFLRER